MYTVNSDVFANLIALNNTVLVLALASNYVMLLSISDRLHYIEKNMD